jgi:hypothetical protein
MATNPIGRGTRNVTVNMSEALKKSLEELAAKSNMSLGEYIRNVLEEARAGRVRYQSKIERVGTD